MGGIETFKKVYMCMQIEKLCNSNQQKKSGNLIKSGQGKSGNLIFKNGWAP